MPWPREQTCKDEKTVKKCKNIMNINESMNIYIYTYRLAIRQKLCKAKVTVSSFAMLRIVRFEGHQV